MYKISLFLFCLVFFTQVNITLATDLAAPTTDSTSATSTLAATTTLKSRAEVEGVVRAYFADLPVMIDIAKCESNFRQFTDSGFVMRGGAGGAYVGVFQFHESSHRSAALALGMDLLSTEGNLAYARHLYRASGTQPWSSCVPTAVSTSVANTSYQKLEIELLTKLLGLLQQLLSLILEEQSQ